MMDPKVMTTKQKVHLLKTVRDNTHSSFITERIDEVITMLEANKLFPKPNKKVKSAITDGKIITAIKEYREQTGCSLMDAKSVVYTKAGRSL